MKRDPDRETLAALHLRLADALDGIKRLFKSPGAMKATLVIRNTELADADIVIGDDDADQVIACITEFKRRVEAGEPVGRQP